jgi:hypothetical protein
MAETAASLQTKIAEAKEALHKLMLGDKETQVNFGTNRLTQWNQVKIPELKAYIAELESELARVLGETRRGPIYPMGDAR